MAKIRPQHTLPERRVRSLLHQAGYRFRLHQAELPGTPDIVMPKYRTAIFVNGCFWHGHSCKIDKMPKSRVEYWSPKIEATRLRDKRKSSQLRRLGWKVITVWECELRDSERLLERLNRLLA